MTGNRSFGNPVYDFRNTDTYTPEAYSAGKKSPVKSSGAKKQAKLHLPPLAAVGGILAAVMLCCSLVAQAQLSAVANDTVALREQNEKLRQEQARLEIQHARAFSPEWLEYYATQVLGMQRPGADQIIYTDSSLEGFLPGE